MILVKILVSILVSLTGCEGRGGCTSFNVDTQWFIDLIFVSGLCLAIVGVCLIAFNIFLKSTTEDEDIER